MIYIRQLQQSLDRLVTLYAIAVKDIPDPLYIAWTVDTIFQGRAPAEEIQGRFPAIMKARKSKTFRNFWIQYKETKAAISNFQEIQMGIISGAKRREYQRRFIKEHPEEVPF